MRSLITVSGVRQKLVEYGVFDLYSMFLHPKDSSVYVTFIEK